MEVRIGEEPEGRRMVIEQINRDGCRIVRAAETLSAESDLGSLRAIFQEYLAEDNLCVVVCLTYETRLFSRLLSLLTWFAEALRNKQGRLTVVHPNSHTISLLKYAGLGRVLSVSSNEESLPELSSASR